MNSIGVDKIYCINLDSKTDRWQRMSERFSKYGLEVQRISGVYPDSEIGKNNSIASGGEACSFTHFLCLQDAKKNNYSKIIIFEDDVKLLTNFIEELVKTINSLTNVDILMLDGCNLNFNLNRGIHKSYNNILASGYMIMNHATIDKLVNILQKQAPLFHIESALVSIQQEGNSYITTPRLCIQEMLCSNIKSYEDVVNMKSWYDRCYFPLYNDYA